jgi:hypothetical protein
MRVAFVSAIALLSGSPTVACSPPFSRWFDAPPIRTDAKLLPAPKVSLRFFHGGLPALEEGDSCEGTALLTLEVAVPSGYPVPLSRLGFEIRQVSGTAAPGYMPEVALMPLVLRGKRPAIYYAWSEIPSDLDGHVRWILEVNAVTRAGRRSKPVQICIATDGSCGA